MKETSEHNARVAKLVFADIYPLYVNKIEKKGRTKEELNQVIEWFTGYDLDKLNELIESKATYKEFFDQATIHPNEHMINGVVCGYRIEELQNVTTRNSRKMEKLIEELARGRKMEKILRQENPVSK